MVTKYSPVELTVIDCVVAPVDQRYELALLEVRVTEPPAQNVVGPDAVIDGAAGVAFAGTAFGAGGAVQVSELPVVTVYEPDCETRIDCVVWTVDHRYELAGLEMSWT